MSREKEFAKNTIILFIGKFATQLSSFLLIPLFTHFLQPDDYGWVDLLQTYISLLVPVLTIRMDSAVFRFLIDTRKDEKKSNVIITNSIIIITVIAIITIICGIILGKIINLKYINYIIINIVIMMFSNVLLQILRGLGKNKQYSSTSIITGVLNLFINSFLIIILKFGANSILIASSISNLCIIAYIVFYTKIYRTFSFKCYDYKILKKMIKYSLPMVPNSLSWWIVSVSDRTIISAFLGASFNGIYSVSCKFSSLINSIFAVFNISWQETASIHINEPDKEEFFSNMIDKMFYMFAGISLVINALIPLFFDLLIGKNYLESYNYIPILLYANIWNIIISLLGGIYIALKRTKEIASTTIVSAVINIVLNFIFIKFFGLYAACFSTLIAYLTMGIYRYIDIRKFVKIKMNVKAIIVYTIIYLISSIVYLINIKVLNIINFIVVCVYSIIVNKEVIHNTFSSALSIIKNKKI